MVKGEKVTSLRGKEIERGLRPLSTQLPSPAMDIFEGLTITPTGEGFTLKGYRGEVGTDNQAQQYFRFCPAGPIFITIVKYLVENT
jgi:hypothetical protein